MYFKFKDFKCLFSSKINVFIITKNLYTIFTRGVAGGGGADGAKAPPEFCRPVNPIQTRAPHTTASPPGFKKLSTSLFTRYRPKIF